MRAQGILSKDLIHQSTRPQWGRSTSTCFAFWNESRLRCHVGMARSRWRVWLTETWPMLTAAWQFPVRLLIPSVHLAGCSILHHDPLQTQHQLNKTVAMKSKPADAQANGALSLGNRCRAVSTSMSRCRAIRVRNWNRRKLTSRIPRPRICSRPGIIYYHLNLAALRK